MPDASRVKRNDHALRDPPSVADSSGEGLDCRSLQEVRGRQVDAEPFTDSCKQLDRGERIYAQREHVVVHPDVLEAEKIANDVSELPFACVARAHVVRLELQRSERRLT